MTQKSLFKGNIQYNPSALPETPLNWSSLVADGCGWSSYQIPSLLHEHLIKPQQNMRIPSTYLNITPDAILRPWTSLLIHNILKKEQELTIHSLLNNLTASFTFINKTEIISFLEEIGVGIDEIFSSFSEINKQVSLKFPKNVKLFVQKYDDPETHDHFISIEIRHKNYPDNFIDRIWEIRDSFSEKFVNNTWILITTDYRPLD